MPTFDVHFNLHGFFQVDAADTEEARVRAEKFIESAP